MKLKNMSKKQLRKEVKNLQEISAGGLLLIESMTVFTLEELDLLIDLVWSGMSGYDAMDIGPEEYAIMAKLVEMRNRADAA